MIYSTQAAAYPYELEAPANLGISPRKDDFEEELKVALPIKTTQEDQLEEVLKNSIQAAVVNEGTDDEADDESADNMDDIDEKQTRVEPQSDQKIDSSNHSETLVRQISDDENVEVEDEDEMQSKAFEARESQWNRKLSIKHSEEKRLRQMKSNLSEAIVRSFEEARNYHAQQQSYLKSPLLPQSD